jgi:hypothetical protein
VRVVLDLAIAFLTLGLVEAVVKPIAKRFMQRRLLQHAPTLLRFLDGQMPSLLQAYRGQELEQVLRTQLEKLTGESWAGESLDALFQLYDPRITADRLHTQPGTRAPSAAQ